MIFVLMGFVFQVGQVINCLKWGVWYFGEYLQLFESVVEELCVVCDDVQIFGLLIIDFEFYLFVVFLSFKYKVVQFDVVVSLFYVDCCGVFENEQMGFDMVGKVELFKSIVEMLCNFLSGCVWIIEMNWLLCEGLYLFVGCDVVVGEDEQVDYFVCYYVFVFVIGFVDCVFWWQLIVKGYGFIDLIGDVF